MKHEFFCNTCKQNKVYESDFTTGYGTDRDGNKHCFDCCAILDKKEMETSNKFFLYLDTKEKTLSNWCGTLKIQLHYIRTGRHNIARKRYDIWFPFVGKNWHGVTYGDNTQICHLSVIK